MSFENNIQDWIIYDNKIKQLNGELNQLRNSRKDLGAIIIQHVTTERLNNATVNISDGNLRFINTKNYTPLTYKYLHSCLKAYFNNEKIVSEFIAYMKENRNDQYNLDIKRSYVNNEQY